MPKSTKAYAMAMQARETAPAAPSAFAGVDEATPPSWLTGAGCADPEDRLGLGSERRQQRQRARRAETAMRQMLAEQRQRARGDWPRLLAQRIELLSMTASRERTLDDEPMAIDYTFEILLNDPEATRFRLPIRVTAEDAATPGEFDEPAACGGLREYHQKAWYGLCRFAQALSELADGTRSGARDASRCRWYGPVGDPL